MTNGGSPHYESVEAVKKPVVKKQAPVAKPKSPRVSNPGSLIERGLCNAGASRRWARPWNCSEPHFLSRAGRRVAISASAQPKPEMPLRVIHAARIVNRSDVVAYA